MVWMIMIKSYTRNISLTIYLLEEMRKIVDIINQKTAHCKLQVMKRAVKIEYYALTYYNHLKLLDIYLLHTKLVLKQQQTLLLQAFLTLHTCLKTISFNCFCVVIVLRSNMFDAKLEKTIL